MALPNLTLRSVKGGNLTAEEFDNNHQRHEQRIDEVEANPTVVSPTDVTEGGGVLTFHFSDNSSFPVTVPNPTPAAPVVVTDDFLFEPTVADGNRYHVCTNAGGCNVLFTEANLAAAAIGTEWHFEQDSLDPVIVAADGAVNLRHRDVDAPQSSGRYAVITCKKVADNQLTIFGDLDESVEEETS
jgi:hypothetical protein